ncbi:MAG: EsaB/YukD family protein [Acetatifactor sp.]|nr:EsaB/YukD family protein [Acetatifactor sp.]
MILVDVVVPSVDKTYDYKLDENAPIGLVLEEITEMISRREHCEMRGNKEEVLLCRYDGQVVLNRLSTLSDSGITDGSRLLLL